MTLGMLNVSAGCDRLGRMEKDRRGGMRAL
jgi:hypothetical protein